MSNFAQRRNKLRKRLTQEEADGFLVTDFTNVTYLTGFTGEDSYLLVTTQDDILVSDQRFTTQLEEECPDLKMQIRGPGSSMVEFTANTVKRAKIGQLAVEATSMTLAFHESLTQKLSHCSLSPVSNWVESLRTIKDRHEIELTRRACEQARRAFEVVKAALRPEMTELEVAAELEYQARRFGGRCLSFPPIVAVGPRAALPHANPTSQRLDAADFTLIDWGVNEGLYVSDLTRMLVTGRILPKLRKVYEVVLCAQQTAIEAIRPGVSCEAVDQIARGVIARAGFGNRFGHGLGHGTGLQVHEAPRLARGQAAELAPGMIVTIEPGIYLPGWGGVRIEDEVLVTRTGHEILTSVPKDLDECVVG